MAGHIKRTIDSLRAFASGKADTNANATSPSESGSAPRARVLCVDDNPQVLHVLQRQLEPDYEVTTAQSSDEALSIIATNAEFDVIISDLKMPKVHGLTFLNRAREIAPDTERIILTGVADPATMAVARSAAGAAKLLIKPCTAEELRGAISEALVRRRGRA